MTGKMLLLTPQLPTTVMVLPIHQVVVTAETMEMAAPAEMVVLALAVQMVQVATAPAEMVATKRRSLRRQPRLTALNIPATWVDTSGASL